jgi:sugar phosphate isomerase/epimerase
VDRTPKRRQYLRHFSVRVTDDELRQLRAWATAAGLSLARYVVASGLGGVPPPLSAEERALRQRAIFHARKIGVNLNQIAHRLNADDNVEPDELAAALRASTEALRRLAGEAADRPGVPLREGV